MSNKQTKFEDALVELHIATVKALKEKIDKGGATAAEIKQAVDLLKNNDIDLANPLLKDGPAISIVADLPFAEGQKVVNLT